MAFLVYFVPFEFCYLMLAGAGFVGYAVCALVVWLSVCCVCLLLALVGFAVGCAMFFAFRLVCWVSMILCAF